MKGVGINLGVDAVGVGISEKAAWGSLPEGAPVAAGAAFQLWTEVGEGGTEMLV